MTTVFFDSRNEAVDYIMNRSHENLTFNLVDGKLIKPEFSHGAKYVLFVFNAKTEEQAHRVVETFEKEES